MAVVQFINFPTIFGVVSKLKMYLPARTPSEHLQANSCTYSNFAIPIDTS